ncbi:unnamed protein product, partial [Amoebophrya sp. A25]
HLEPSSENNTAEDHQGHACIIPRIRNVNKHGFDIQFRSPLRKDPRLVTTSSSK